MAKLIAIYRTPNDPAAFDRYYFQKHLPLAKTIPGLTRYEVSRGPVGALGPGEGVHLIATLHFESRAAIEAALASPEGGATAGDLANFADGGVEVFYSDVETV